MLRLEIDLIARFYSTRSNEFGRQTTCKMDKDDLKDVQLSDYGAC